MFFLHFYLMSCQVKSVHLNFVAVLFAAIAAEDLTTWLSFHLLAKVETALAEFLLYWLWPTLEVEGLLHRQLLCRIAPFQILHFLHVWTLEKNPRAHSLS